MAIPEVIKDWEIPVEEGNYNSALAQLVEQMTVNHWVAGSSPAGGANI